MNKINKIIMKKKNTILIKGFYFCNLILLIFYLFPGSLLGYFFYKNIHIQPQITKDFMISSNHFYIFFILSVIGILAYCNTNKIYLLIKYLFLMSIILEFFHIIIPNREFEWVDLIGNTIGVAVVIIFYKIKKKYE